MLLCVTIPPLRSNALLEYALLLYFERRYEEAWTELGCVLQVGWGERWCVAAACLAVLCVTHGPRCIWQAAG